MVNVLLILFGMCDELRVDSGGDVWFASDAAGLFRSVCLELSVLDLVQSGASDTALLVLVRACLLDDAVRCSAVDAAQGSLQDCKRGVSVCRMLELEVKVVNHVSNKPECCHVSILCPAKDVRGH